jgi:hypothetical protein
VARARTTAAEPHTLRQETIRAALADVTIERELTSPR